MKSFRPMPGAFLRIGVKNAGGQATRNMNWKYDFVKF